MLSFVDSAGTDGEWSGSRPLILRSAGSTRRRPIMRPSLPPGLRWMHGTMNLYMAVTGFNNALGYGRTLLAKEPNRPKTPIIIIFITSSTVGCPRFQLLLQVDGTMANVILFSIPNPIVPFFRELTCSTPCALALKFWNFYGCKKKVVFNPFSYRGPKDAAWWEDYKSGLEFKSDIIWPPFCQKRSKNWHNRVFCQFSTAFWPKSASNVFRFEFWVQIWNLLIKAHLLDHKMKMDW